MSPTSENDDSKPKLAISLITSVWEWGRSVMREVEDTKHPGTDIGILNRLIAAILGCIFLISGCTFALAANRPIAFYAIKDSFINAPIVSYSSIIILIAILLTLSLSIQKYGTFTEHVKRACIYPVLLVLFCVLPICIIFLLLGIVAIGGAA